MTFNKTVKECVKKLGKFEYYFENGQLRVEGSYKNGTRTGVFSQYDEEGNLELKGIIDEQQLTELEKNHENWSFY